MDFGIYPPEINSGRMYTGPGPGPMLAAAQAWAALADVLAAAASAYESVVSALTIGAWFGPSATAMATAAGAHVGWLSATATAAGETATQATAAVAAYEAAFASTVPPPVIAANRSLLMTLAATNLLGQNTPAIAAAEAQYAQMWAQDAVAMYGYAASSTSATELTPFTAPQQSANPGALASQAAAAAAADPVTTLTNLITIFLSAPADLAALFVCSPMAILAPVDLPFCLVDTLTGLHADDIVSGWAGVAPWPGQDPALPTQFRATITGPTQSSAVSARLSGADTVGAVSVPSAWTTAAPEAQPAALTLAAVPDSTVSAAEAADRDPARTFSQLVLAAMTGSGIASPSSGSPGGRPVAGSRQPPRPGRIASSNGNTTTVGDGTTSAHAPRIVLTGIAARIRELAKLRDDGTLTAEEFTAEKDRLLSH